MKDNILGIIIKHDAGVHEQDICPDQLANELTEFMCYREVRAFVNGIEFVNGAISAEEVLDCFVDTYGREQVVKAIVRVKNEII